MSAHGRGRGRAWIWTVLALVAVIIGLATVLTMITGARSTNARQSSSSDSRRNVQVPSTSTTAPPVTTTTVTPAASLGTRETSYLQSRAGDATVAVYDITSGKTWLYHPGDAQDTASIVKVDIMATLLAQAEASKAPLSSADAALLTPMIEASDNDAATTLWNAAGSAPGIGHYNSSIGMTGTTPSPCVQCTGFPWPGWGLTTTTAADQITLLRQLVLPGGSLDAGHRQQALTLLENVEPSERWGVSGGVPTGVTMALKNGWVPLTGGLWQIDSIGWINGEGRNYLIAVLTNGNPTEQYGIDTIDTLSAMIWASLGTPSP